MWYDDNSHLWGNEDYDEAMQEDAVGILHRRSYPRETIHHNKHCRLCGETGLRWLMVDGNWRLAHGDTIHVCPYAALPEKTPSLIPCPFCGSDKLRVSRLYQEPEVGMQFDRFAVVCDDCGMHGPAKGLNNGKAIALWNTRKSTQ